MVAVGSDDADDDDDDGWFIVNNVGDCSEFYHASEEQHWVVNGNR